MPKFDKKPLKTITKSTKQSTKPFRLTPRSNKSTIYTSPLRSTSTLQQQIRTLSTSTRKTNDLHNRDIIKNYQGDTTFVGNGKHIVNVNEPSSNFGSPYTGNFDTIQSARLNPEISDARIFVNNAEVTPVWIPPNANITNRNISDNFINNPSSASASSHQSQSLTSKSSPGTHNINSEKSESQSRPRNIKNVPNSPSSSKTSHNSSISNVNPTSTHSHQQQRCGTSSSHNFASTTHSNTQTMRSRSPSEAPGSSLSHKPFESFASASFSQYQGNVPYSSSEDDILYKKKDITNDDNFYARPSSSNLYKQPNISSKSSKRHFSTIRTIHHDIPDFSSSTNTQTAIHHRGFALNVTVAPFTSSMGFGKQLLAQNDPNGQNGQDNGRNIQNSLYVRKADRTSDTNKQHFDIATRSKFDVIKRVVQGSSFIMFDESINENKM